MDRLSPFSVVSFSTSRHTHRGRNVSWLVRNKDTGMCARRGLKLCEYNFIIEHASAATADALSRAPFFQTADESSTPQQTNEQRTPPQASPSVSSVDVVIVPDPAIFAAPIPVTVRIPEPPGLSHESLVKDQRNDAFCITIVDALLQNSGPLKLKASRSIAVACDKLHGFIRFLFQLRSPHFLRSSSFRSPRFPGIRSFGPSQDSR